MSEFSLNDDQRYMLNLYSDMYNQQVQQINSLYTSLDVIRENIEEIVHSRDSTHIFAPRTRMPTFARPLPRQAPRQQAQRQQTPRQQARQTVQTQQRRRTLYTDPVVNRIYTSHIPNNDDIIFNRTFNRNIPINYDVSFNNVITSRLNRPITMATNAINLLNSFYDPVIIRPTQIQLNNATNITIFSDIEYPINTNCPITLEQFEPDSAVTQLLGCNHIFNTSSINSWFQNNVRCPVCRSDIRDFVYAPNNMTSRSRTRYESNNMDVENDVDSDAESELEYEFEETKEEDITFNRERNSIPINNNVENPDSEYMSNLATITESLLNQLFNGTMSGGETNMFNDTTTRYYIDSSNNELIIEGIIRNNDNP